MKNLRSLDEIRAWAKSKPPNASVGLSGRSESCPLSQCHTELDDTAVGYWAFTGNRIAVGDGRIVTPDYIYHIIARVDGTGILYASVTAARFLAILDEVEAQERARR